MSVAELRGVHNYMRTPTFKKYTTVAFIVEAVFAIVCIVGWFRGLENPVGMMNCDAMAFIGTIAVYGGKAGFEHSQWATPLVAGIASGLSSGDPATGVQSAISAYESEKQMQTIAEPTPYDTGNLPPEDMQNNGADAAVQTEQKG